jgi:RHS repeat-associated protein
MLTWIGNDPQATVQVSVNAVSNAVSRQRYLPFGAHRGGRDDITETDRGFLGQVEDPSGLVQVGARYYDPVTGKFISTDPMYDMTKPQSLNPYTYALANPATYSDPTGLKACEGSTGNDRCAPGQRPDNGHSGDDPPPPSRNTPGTGPNFCERIGCFHGGEPRAAAVPPLPPAPEPAPAPSPEKRNHCTVAPGTSYGAASVIGRCGPQISQGAHGFAKFWHRYGKYITAAGVVVCVAATEGLCAVAVVSVATASATTRSVDYFSGPKTPEATKEYAAGLSIDIATAGIRAPRYRDLACGCTLFNKWALRSAGAVGVYGIDYVHTYLKH